MSAAAAFPADDPIWNTGGANRVTPSGAKQALGWAASESPSSAFFNWFMFFTGEYIQHYKNEVVQLHSIKLDRNGGNMINGTIVTVLDNANDWGSSVKRFANIFGTNVHVYGDLDLEAGSAIDGDVLPKATNTFLLGSSSFKWAGLFATVANINTVTVNTQIVPDAAGGANCGVNGTAWASVVGRRVTGTRVIGFNDSDPSNQEDLVSLSQLNHNVCIARISGATGALLFGYNVDGVVKTGTGRYTVNLKQAVSPFVGGTVSRNVAETPNFAISDSVTVDATGLIVTVRLNEGSLAGSTTAAVDKECTVILAGIPNVMQANNVG